MVIASGVANLGIIRYKKEPVDAASAESDEMLTSYRRFPMKHGVLLFFMLCLPG